MDRSKTNGKLLTPLLLRGRPMPPRASASSLVPLCRFFFVALTRYSLVETQFIAIVRALILSEHNDHGTLHDTSDVNRRRHALYCIALLTREITIARYDSRSIFTTFRNVVLITEKFILKTVSFSFYCHAIQYG